MEKSFVVGNRTFVLDQAKAEGAYAEKRVINGRKSEAFNLLPLKYQWAYDLYKKMKANHWEPEDIQMQKDVEQWHSPYAITRQRALGDPHGDRLFFRGRRDRGRQHPARGARIGDGAGTEAGAGPPRARGEHPRRLAALHDLLARHQPARVRGDVRADRDHEAEKRIRHPGQPRTCAATST